MKTISLMVACYNEKENIRRFTEALVDCMENKLPAYDYEILIIDNHSNDGTREILRELASENRRVRVILNAANFGQMKSPFYGLTQTSGDCAIKLCADFQDPVELIPVFVKEWEKGNKIVIGIKNHSKENRVMYSIRTMYYKLFSKLSDVEHIAHFTGFGLYDRSFIDILRQLKDPIPYFRGIVAEYAKERKEIYYTQPERAGGKSKNNLLSLYDIGITGLTTYSKALMRLATLVGLIASFISLGLAVFYFIYKLTHWDTFTAGIAPAVVGLFLLGGIELIFIGVLGEYILTINNRVMGRPLVVEEERINFDESGTNEK